MNTYIKPLVERISRLWHRVRFSWPVWYYVINVQGRTSWLREQRPGLNDEQNRILQDLQRDGIAITHVSRLGGDETWQALQRYFASLMARPEIHAKIRERRSGPESRGDKYYNVLLWDPPVCDLENPVMRFVLGDAVAHTVNAYMRMWTKFRGANFWASMPVSAGANPHASQNWHRDPEDKKLVKVFIYYGDVDEETGPFTYVKGSQMGGKWRKFYPQIPPIGRYPPPGAVEKTIPAGDILKAMGRAGSMVFCDTSGMHRGGYCTGKTRYMTQHAFASAASADPAINYVFPTGFSRHTLSSRIRYALDNKR